MEPMFFLTLGAMLGVAGSELLRQWWRGDLG